MLFINVKSPPYNAVGDGLADDTVAIQNAVNDASADGGGFVYIPPGSYKLTTWTDDAGNGYFIKLANNVYIVGAGESITNLIGAYDNTSILYAREANLIGIAHLTLKRTGTTGNADQIKLLSSQNIQIFDVEALGGRMGYQLIGCDTGYIVDCTARNQVNYSGSDANGFSVCDLAGVSGTTDNINLVNCSSFSSAAFGMALSKARNIGLVNCFTKNSGTIGIDINESDYNELVNCKAYSSQEQGIRIRGSSYNCLIACKAINNSQSPGNAAGFDFQQSGTPLQSTYNRLIGCLATDTQGTKTQTWGLSLGNASDYNKFIGCDFVSNIQNVYISTTGVNNKFRNVGGYTNENKGTGTITSGNTAITITHGLNITPTAQDIQITPTNNPTNDPGHIWVSNINATTFNVNCRNDPGASGLNFGWQVIES